MSRYRLTPRAREGLAGILEYVGREFGLDTAESLLDQLVATFELIADQPGIGHIREDVTDDRTVRFWSVAPTLIAYRAKGDAVEILIIERGERDWTHLFREGS